MQQTERYTVEQWARDNDAAPNAQDRGTAIGRTLWYNVARVIQQDQQYATATGLAQRLAQEDGRNEPNDLDIRAAEWAFDAQEPAR